MSKINKISVDGITYDIEDKSVPSWAKSSAKPSYKTSELENDSNFITETKVDEKIASVATGGSGSTLDNYSTEEQIVGTWIDGKPIYRRVVEFTFSSTQNTWNLVVSQTFTSLLKCCGFFKDTTVFMNFPVTSGNEILAVYGNGTTGVYEKHNYSYPNGKSGYLIIEYTK